MDETASEAKDVEVYLKARDDLKLEQQDGKFILNDPIKNSFTRLGVAEYLVYRCFDGNSSLEDIIARLKKERDVTLLPDQLERLAAQLSEKQLLLKPGEQVTEEKIVLQDGGGFLDKITMIDIGLVHNPDRWLTALFHRIKHICFRPAFFVFFFVTGLLAASIWLSSWSAISEQFSALEATGGTIALLWVCLTLSLLLHEIGHGVATKGFGGKVPRMGAFIYFFNLAWYCDVSASYMFTSKFRKQMVLMAGPMVTFLLLFLATIGWRLTIQGGPANTVCFMLMLINSGLTIATLDPLFKGDGYYMICTWLDMPNLTQNAQAYVRASIARNVFRRKVQLPTADARQARIFWRWMLIKKPATIAFFLYFGIRFLVFATKALGVLSLYLLAIFVYDRLGKPLHRLADGSLRYLSAALRSRDARALLLHLVAPVKHVGPRLVKPLTIIIPLIIIAHIPYRDSTSAPFTIVSMQAHEIHSELGGVLVAYHVHQGDFIEAGDVIARLADHELKAEKAEAEAVLRELQLALELAKRGPRVEEIAIARSQVQSDALQVSYWTNELERDRALHESGTTSDKALAELQSNVNIAKIRKRESLAETRLLAAGTRPENIEVAQALVAAQVVRLKEIDRKLEASTIRAPWKGKVVTQERVLRSRVDQWLAPGAVIVRIVDGGSLMARVEFEEWQVSLLNQDREIELRSFLDPQAVQKTRVRAVGRVAHKNSDEPDASRRIHAWADFRFDDVEWSIGSTGRAKIATDSQPLYRVVYMKGIRGSWVTLWSWL